ncbi:MAG: ribonuclease P protein component 1 [Candidatus Methanospirareceae archaeon]
MKLRPGNLLQHELIGLQITVDESTNGTLAGLRGTVVNETRNMLVIETAQRAEKSVSKTGNWFIFTLDDGVRVRVKGDRLVARPEDRIKKR